MVRVHRSRRPERSFHNTYQYLHYSTSSRNKMSHRNSISIFFNNARYKVSGNIAKREEGEIMNDEPVCGTVDVTNSARKPSPHGIQK